MTQFRVLFFALVSISQILFLTRTVASPLSDAIAGGDELRMQTPSKGPSLASDPHGWWPFFSTQMGLMDYSGRSGADDGHAIAFKGLMSFYNSERSWVFDGGVGLYNTGAKDVVTTGLVEAAARFRFRPRWELGPVGTVFIGNGDKLGSSADNFTSFVGASILHDIPLQNGHLLRAGGRFQSDVGIPNQTANLFLFEIHYGFDWSNSSSALTSSAAAPSASEESPSSTQEIPQAAALAPHLADANRLEVLNWPKQGLLFAPRQVEPNSTDQRRLAALVEELMGNVNLVEGVKVVGHADQVGNEYTNSMLSLARAQAVANILIFSGMPQSKVVTLGRGEQDPITRSRIDANRRVELEFFGVKDNNKLNSVLRKYGF